MCVRTFQEEKDGFENTYNTHSKLEINEDYGLFRAADLKHRITELIRIKSNTMSIVIYYIKNIYTFIYACFDI